VLKEDVSENRGGDSAGCSPIELARAMRRLDLALAGMHLEISSRMNMTQAELLAIAWLAMDGDLGPTELAHRLHLRTGAVTAVLDRLEQRGHVVREPHPSDRRRLLVRLTDTARSETMAHLRPMVDDMMELSRGLTAEDRRRIGQHLDAVAAIVATYATDRPPTEGPADGPPPGGTSSRPSR
jgi:DNA-binding MarR family transcriptional regulator